MNISLAQTFQSTAWPNLINLSPGVIHRLKGFGMKVITLLFLRFLWTHISLSDTKLLCNMKYPFVRKTAEMFGGSFSFAKE